MTKSKRVFAEMLVQARGHGDPDEIAKTMSLVDIIYEMKKEELKKEEPPSTETPPPPNLKKRRRRSRSPRLSSRLKTFGVG